MRGRRLSYKKAWQRIPIAKRPRRFASKPTTAPAPRQQQASSSKQQAATAARTLPSQPNNQAPRPRLARQGDRGQQRPPTTSRTLPGEPNNQAHPPPPRPTGRQGAAAAPNNLPYPTGRTKQPSLPARPRGGLGRGPQPPPIQRKEALKNPRLRGPSHVQPEVLPAWPDFSRLTAFGRGPLRRSEGVKKILISVWLWKSKFLARTGQRRFFCRFLARKKRRRPPGRQPSQRPRAYNRKRLPTRGPPRPPPPARNHPGQPGPAPTRPTPAPGQKQNHRPRNHSAYPAYSPAPYASASSARSNCRVWMAWQVPGRAASAVPR